MTAGGCFSTPTVIAQEGSRDFATAIIDFLSVTGNGTCPFDFASSEEDPAYEGARTLSGPSSTGAIWSTSGLCVCRSSDNASAPISHRERSFYSAS